MERAGLLFIAVVIFLGGCTGLAPVLRTIPEKHEAIGDTDCLALLQTLDDLVAIARTGDAQASRIKGFPYLRTNRLLSSYRNEDLGDRAYDAWVGRMLVLDREARSVELANMPLDSRTEVRTTLKQHGKGDINAQIEACGNRLANQQLSTTTVRHELRQRALVEESYRLEMRIAGLYPVTLLPVAYGVHRWQKRTSENHRAFSNAEPADNQSVIYSTARMKENIDHKRVAAILDKASKNPLRIPLPEERQRDYLFSAFAPVWEVDQASGSDAIGAPVWLDPNGPPMVDTTRPTVFRHISHSRFHGHTLLQLNYVIWFPSRPCTSPLDILCGQLDGLTWRVTLSPQGEPLIYDSIHNCGCYHLFYPTVLLDRKPSAPTLDEGEFVPATAPIIGDDERLVIRLSAGNHYIESVYSTAALGFEQKLAWGDYNQLRSLPLPGGDRRSLFLPKSGLVQGSERAERWILWPMGVISPGAMRQWGHHATAFVGQRHFDDPFLFESAFQSAQPTELPESIPAE
ncbi:MAG: hypothetical protein GY792_29120 [Gammaproteobacteria bacterium]|nr:hypothetical protein [Gammaproteobacteria bacterium]